MSSLKQAREDRGVKLSAVADHLGVSRQTYSKYEDNPGDMSIDQAKAVCDFLRVELCDIFFAKRC